MLKTLREREVSKSNAFISLPTKTSKKHQKLFKQFGTRPSTKKEKVPDNVDRLIIKKNGPKTKVPWSNREDQCLLMCKTGEMFLNRIKSQKQQIVYSAVVRDIMHRVCPASRNKTSKYVIFQSYFNAKPCIKLLCNIHNIF